MLNTYPNINIYPKERNVSSGEVFYISQNVFPDRGSPMLAESLPGMEKHSRK